MTRIFPTFAGEMLREYSRSISPANVGKILVIQSDDFQRPQLRQASFHRQVTRPQQPPRAEDANGVVEHSAIDATPGEIRIDVRRVNDCGKRVRVIAAAADV